MKKIRSLSLLLAAAFLMSLFAACSSGGQSSAAPSGSASAGSAAQDADGAKQVAFLAPMTSSEYWMTITENTKAACEAAGYTCTIYSAENDGATQLQQIENVTTMGVDAIVIDPLDAASADDALIRAREAGIFVIQTGSVSDNLDSYDVAISASETEVGQAAAQAAADWIDATFPDAADGSVGVALYNFPFRPTDVERCEGFEKVTEYTAKASIAVRYELSLTNYATEVMDYAAVMMQQYPDVKCIISYSDTFANSIDEILRGTAGIDLTKVANITIDQSTATYTNITLSKNGESTVVATVVPGINLADQLVEALDGTLEFDDEAKRVAYKDITVMNGSNVDQYFTAE